MRSRGKSVAEDKIEAEKCHHFWVIEIANGPTSHGKCKYCGEVKEFYNSIMDLTDPKRKTNPLNLPKMSRVKLDKGSIS